MPTTKPRPRKNVAEPAPAPQSVAAADRLVRDAFTFARCVESRKVLIGFENVSSTRSVTSADSAAEWPSFVNVPLVASRN